MGRAGPGSRRWPGTWRGHRCYQPSWRPRPGRRSPPWRADPGPQVLGRTAPLKQGRAGSDKSPGAGEGAWLPHEQLRLLPALGVKATSKCRLTHAQCPSSELETSRRQEGEHAALRGLSQEHCRHGRGLGLFPPVPVCSSRPFPAGSAPPLPGPAQASRDARVTVTSRHPQGLTPTR